ncbi:ATP/GTP-binding protein [Streptomyces sp. NBC_00386]|uniref:ATP/GTP-binding protein n=1 Tax=Streptomyces sp. NBC_00386 TaxID=2975734 RepID=UPI002E2462CF
MVTKVLLLAIFLIGLIAQFVKPVGDALEGKAYLGGALLSLVGYVLYAEVQRLNAAHETQRDGTGALRVAAQRLEEEVRRLGDEVQQLKEERLLEARDLVTADDLGAEFVKALQTGEDVHFSAMGFTGETLARPLGRILEGIHRNPERTIHVRVLVPDFTKPMEVPGWVGMDGKIRDAPMFRQSLLEKIKGHETDLKRQAGRMAGKGQGRLNVEFRVMQNSPSLKLCLINSDQVFEGFYDKTECRHGEYDSAVAAGEGGELSGGHILDLLGYDSLLKCWSLDGDRRSREMIARRQEFFNTFWDAAHEFSGVSAGSAS